MIDFHYAKLEEKAAVDAILAKTKEKACEYCFANMYAWVESYNTEIAFVDGCITAEYADGVYLFPVGGDVRAAILHLREFADSEGVPFILVCMSEENARLLEELFPGEYEIREERDSFDYLYSAEKLATLAGRKLSKKRNHIHHFEQQQSDWSFEPLSESNIPEALEMDEKWFETELLYDGSSTLRGDNTALHRCLKNFEVLGLDGAILRVDGKVVAFTAGSLMQHGEVFVTHFEKAFDSVDGSYAMINREFAKYIHEKYPSVQYINREDDLGIPGLRQAKMTYYPELLLSKFSAVPKVR